ncbi:MAG TPA: nucleoside deaminase [Dehalococcoidia bacterium]|nr:nucleoside deaminase [Dehalococcoidia bacterium]MDP7160301.1 nucleoside deaminase [Dehalococcoidia bacterium]MDP7213498.1 nucleoside deaminase [Dehalococcoidia bacterium]MDP7514240.1 nucleoside deaminase [Dehalococcoidia bacterium]HJM52543.1 nucleoside deaminase [Dehalococcoidia bacterium]
MTNLETHEKFMHAALAEAAVSAAEGNQGVGSVIVLDGKIIAAGRNIENTDHDPTAHAETVAIRNYAASHARNVSDESWGRYVGAQRILSGATLYSTFEPCPMCCGAILIAGISTMVLGGRPTSRMTKWGDYTAERMVDLTAWGDRIEVITGVLVDECFNARNR